MTAYLYPSLEIELVEYDIFIGLLVDALVSFPRSTFKRAWPSLETRCGSSDGVATSQSTSVQKRWIASLTTTICGERTMRSPRQRNRSAAQVSSSPRSHTPPASSCQAARVPCKGCRARTGLPGTELSSSSPSASLATQQGCAAPEMRRQETPVDDPWTVDDPLNATGALNVLPASADTACHSVSLPGEASIHATRSVPPASARIAGPSTGQAS